MEYIIVFFMLLFSVKNKYGKINAIKCNNCYNREICRGDI